MKNKKNVQVLLSSDLIKYSKQMGIMDCEIPELVFDYKEFEAKDKETEDRLGLDIRDSRQKHLLGMSSISRRMILVRLDRTPKMTWKVTKRTRKYIEKSRVPYGLREARNTLVHELVHYRFPYMSHGAKFEERIKDIIYRGKEFPAKHLPSPEIINYRLSRGGC